jgi:CRISPR-associated protein Cmr2
MNIDYFVELDKQIDPQNTDEFTTRYHRLIAGGKKKDADALRTEWSKKAGRAVLSEPSDELWKMIAKPIIDLASLPPASWFLQFTFTLAKPYISKDDNPFYIIDNPIVRDKVFQLPLVRPASWKGNLYSALWQLGHDKQDDEQMQRLFGEIRGEEGGRSGRLYFYPAFFTQTSLEIINPHDRKRRVGKNPILFESVPAGAQGTFSLLYVPFDLIGREEAETKQQALDDLQLVAEGLQAMFLTYGFSAKRTSGYGVAKETVSDGFVQIRIEETQTPPASAPTTPEPSLPKYLQAPGKLKDEYLNPDGTFRERSQAELAKMTKAQKQEYDKAKKWWEREGKAIASQPPAEPESKPAEAPAPTWLKREFDSFDKLCEIAESLAKEGGAG